MDELMKLREEIRALDWEMQKLFLQRLSLARRIGRYKKAQGLAVHDSVREAENIAVLETGLDAEERVLYHELLVTVMAAAKQVQR